MNVLKKWLITGFSVIVLASLNSCDLEDQVTLTNPNEITVDTYWNDLNEINTGLTAVYAATLNQNIYAFNLDALRTDMAWPGFGRPNTNDNEGNVWYLHQYNNSTGAINQRWEALYKVIFRANQVIEALDNYEVTSEEEQLTWIQIMAQARFLRGLHHFFISALYNEGNVIISDFIPKNFEETNIPLSSAQEVVDFYRADLRYAFQHLPAEYENENVGRVTKGAASAFLGKSFLYQGEYDSAILRFEDVINNAEYGYRLVDDPSLMFSAAGEHNRESIYEINYGDNDLYYPERNNFDDENFYNRWDWMCLAGRGIKVPAWLAYAYRTEVIDTTDFRNTLYREVDLPDPDGDEDEFDTVIDTVQRTVSMRASSMVTLVEDDLVPYFINGAAAHNGRFTWDGWGFSQFKKYSNWDVDTGSEDGLNNSTKNVTVLRLAEVYLMLAECYIQVGNTQQALSMVNANRARWGLRQLGIDNNVSGPMFDGYNYLADPDSLMNFIMFHEKPLELSMEGFAVRPIDFRRWNVGKQVFNRLANSTFYMADHSYRLWRSRELSVNTASSVVVDPALSGGPVIDFEYDLAAEGYDPTVHSWFPIPLQEVIVNNKID